jgi:hypothetical protein
MRSQYALSALALLAVAHHASASTFNATDDVTYSGTTAVVSPRNPANGSITPTVFYGIGDAYNGGPIAGDFPGSLADPQNKGGGPWNFYDDYIFTVGTSGSSIQSALISFSTSFYGISDLQGRIIGAGGTFNAANNLGNPASGNTVVDGWTSTVVASGVNIVNLNKTAFGPGTYDLQIRGEVLGAPPIGGYGGVIAFTPVPLPAALPLLLSGLGLFGGLKRRTRANAS